MSITAGTTEADGGRVESAEDLAALPAGELFARRAPYDQAIGLKSKRFFETLNRWLSATVPALAELDNILSVEGWDNFSSGNRVIMRFRCRLNLVRGHLTEALFRALGSFGLASMVPDFARQEISLAFPADFLDVSDMGILVERAQAAVRAKRLADDGARGHKLPGPEVSGVVAGVREAVGPEVAAVAAVAAEAGGKHPDDK